MENWQIVIGAVVAGVALVVGAFFSGLKEVVVAWMAKLKRRVSRATYIQRIRILAAFLEDVERFHDIKEVDRVLVFRGHNCGGLPAAGRPYCVRAVYGWARGEQRHDPVERYDFDMQVDPHYTRLLEDMVKFGVTIQVTAKMPIDAKLRRFYLDEGVVSARKYFLGIEGEDLVYLSVASFSGEFPDDVANRIDLRVERIRSIIAETNG